MSITGRLLRGTSRDREQGWGWWGWRSSQQFQQHTVTGSLPSGSWLHLVCQRQHAYFHLLFNCIMQKGSISNFVDGISVLKCFGEFKLILRGALMASSSSATKKIIYSLFLMTQLTHQLKAGSSVIWAANMNSTTWSVWGSLKSDSFCQEVLLSYNSHHNVQPHVEQDTIFLQQSWPDWPRQQPLWDLCGSL